MPEVKIWRWISIIASRIFLGRENTLYLRTRQQLALPFDGLFIHIDDGFP